MYLELWSCRREGISMQDFGENKPHKSDLLEGSEEESGVAAAAATAADRELSFYLSFLLSLSLFLSLSFFPSFV